MKGLLDGVKETLTNAVLDKATDALGIESKWMKAGIKTVLPAIIGGVINKGSSPAGAGGLLDLFKSGGFGNDNLGDLMGVFGDSEKTSGLLETGGGLLKSIFGSSQSGLTDMLINLTGMNDGALKTLLKFLAPMVINKLAGISSSNNLDANGLSSYLGNQQSSIASAVPGLAGFFSSDAVSESVGSAASSATARRTEESSDNGGGGLMKWLLPILGLALLGYFMNQNGCFSGEAEDTTEETTVGDGEMQVEKEATTATAVEATNDEGTAKMVGSETANAKMNYNLSDAGDIVNSAGDIIHKTGSFKLDDNGNLVDMAGKVLIPAASLSSDLLARIKSALGLTGAAVTQEQMKMMFSNMLVKKEGTKSSYGLSDIEFDDEGYKITNFSKAEVIGLAEALKANADGKIEVQVYTADGKDDKENEKFSKSRAEVVRDMLVTLGVNKKQISAKGMGNSNAAKAGIGKVEIAIK